MVRNACSASEWFSDSILESLQKQYTDMQLGSKFMPTTDQYALNLEFCDLLVGSNTNLDLKEFASRVQHNIQCL